MQLVSARRSRTLQDCVGGERVRVSHLVGRLANGQDRQISELVCIECGEASGTHSCRGWRGYLVDLDEDGQDEVAFYCPPCAAHEFDTTRPAS